MTETFPRPDDVFISKVTDMLCSLLSTEDRYEAQMLHKNHTHFAYLEFV